jgi:hypothetical protein
VARGKTPADDAAVEQSAAETSADPFADPFAGVPCWRYAGPDRRIYVDVPVTVDPGDVVPAAKIPSGDGFWAPTNVAYTRVPDNFDGGVTGG